MRQTLIAFCTVVAVASTPTVQAATQPPPHLTSTTVSPVAAPYPDASLAPLQVKEALTTARKTGRKVLLDFGANWCPDCRILAGVFALTEAQAWLESQFVIVPINVERFTRNLDIGAKYGVKIKAIPTVLILTPDGRALNSEASLALGNARTLSPQASLDLIAAWNEKN